MNKNWLKSYQSGVPESIDPDSYDSICQMISESVADYGDNPAFNNLGVTLSFREVDKHSNSLANYFLQELNLQKGDRVAIMMPNLLQYPIVMFGVLKAGLTVVNVNPLYTATELKNQLQDSGASVVVVLENFAHTVEKAIGADSSLHVIITKVADLIPKPKACLINFVVRYIKKMIPKWNLHNKIYLGRVLKKYRTDSLVLPKISSSDIAFLQYTGGTTGGPKGAMLTHKNMIANVLQAKSWIQPIAEEGSEIVITALPLYHIFSLTANCLTFFLIGGLNVLITNPKDIKELVNTLASFKFTNFTGVNTLFNALLNNDDFLKLDFSNLKLGLGGGMAVQKTVAEKWQEVTNSPLLEAYGLTEASPAVCMNPMNLKSYNGSIGLPISSTEVSIRDEDNQELPVGSIGELWVRGPQVMRGYWNKPEETAKVLTTDKWLKTGDIATIDSDGFVKLVDRKKDMILVSGFNVYPNEIEEVISQHPKVLEVAVVGIAINNKEVVKAFIVPKNISLNKDEIITLCRQHLTAYKIPKEIEFRTSLPKTNVGKILRRALRE